MKTIHSLLWDRSKVAFCDSYYKSAYLGGYILVCARFKSRTNSVCRLYLNFWNLWLNLFTSWRKMSAWKVNKIQLLLLGLRTKTLNNDILCTVDCSMVNLFWFRLCVAGLPTDPLAGWRHRLRDGNSLDFKNPRGVPRQNHVYLLRSTLAQGGLVL